MLVRHYGLTCALVCRSLLSRLPEVDNYAGVVVGPEVTDDALKAWWLEGFDMAVADAKLLEMDVVGITGPPTFLHDPLESIPNYRVKSSSANKTSRQILRDLQHAWNLQQFGSDDAAGALPHAHVAGVGIGAGHAGELDLAASTSELSSSDLGPDSHGTGMVGDPTTEALTILLADDSDLGTPSDRPDQDQIVGSDVTFDDVRHALGDSVTADGVLVNDIGAVEEAGASIGAADSPSHGVSDAGGSSETSGLDHYIDVPTSDGGSRSIHVQRLLALLADVGSISHDRSVRYRQSKAVVSRMQDPTLRSAMLNPDHDLSNHKLRVGQDVAVHFEEGLFFGRVMMIQVPNAQRKPECVYRDVSLQDRPVGAKVICAWYAELAAGGVGSSQSPTFVLTPMDAYVCKLFMCRQSCSLL